MRIKPDWAGYLHTLRRREIGAIFAGCPPRAFAHGLELGAGDGFQSQLLASYVVSLVVTDYYEDILKLPDTPASADTSLVHQICDAERVDEQFAPAELDFVFSSNMLEHLPDPQRALRGMRLVLRDDGLMVHVMPSPFWKLTQMVGFFPDAIISRIERYTAHRSETAVTAPAPEADAGCAAHAFVQGGNNPKVQRNNGYLRRLLWPLPHGVSASNLAEFRAFHPARWMAEFATAGFRVHRLIRGPVSSGYGFGLNGMRAVLERLGWASEYAYVVVKSGQVSPYECFF